MAQRSLNVVACCVLCCALVDAQMPRDSFLLYGTDPYRSPWSDGLFVYPNGSPWLTLHNWGGATPYGTAMVAEDGKALYFAVPSILASPGYPGPFHFYRAILLPNQTFQETLLGTYPNPANSYISALAVAGDNLWFATRAAFLQTAPSLVGTLSKSLTNQTVGTVLDLGQLGYPQTTFFEARSNGRDVFLWGFTTMSWGPTLALDTSRTPPTVRVVAGSFSRACYANGKLVSYILTAPQVAQFTLVDPLTGSYEVLPSQSSRVSTTTSATTPGPAHSSPVPSSSTAPPSTSSRRAPANGSRPGPRTCTATAHSCCRSTRSLY